MSSLTQKIFRNQIFPRILSADLPSFRMRENIELNLYNFQYNGQSLKTAMPIDFHVHLTNSRGINGQWGCPHYIFTSVTRAYGRDFAIAVDMTG